MSHSAAMDQILVDVLIRKRKWQWITYKLRKSDNSIAGYAMKWNPLSQDSRRVGHPRTAWCRTVEECKLPFDSNG